MNKQELIAAINEYITSNGVQEITGQVMNLILNSIASIIPDDTMLTSSFGGIVDPNSTINITPGVTIWFWAAAGTYASANNLVITKQGVLSFDGTEWSSLEFDVPSLLLKTTFNENNNVDGSTMNATAKYINNRLGVAINLNPVVVTYNQDDGDVETSLKINNVALGYADPNARTQVNIPLNGAQKVIIDGYFLKVANQGNVGLLGIKPNGDVVEISSGLPDYFQNLNNEYNVSQFDFISIGMAGNYSVQVFEETVNLFPTISQYFAQKKDVLNVFKDKKIMLAGDSRMSTDYSFLSTEMQKYTAAINVYSGGFSGHTQAQLAMNVSMQRIFDFAPDYVAFLSGGNDSGSSGTIGTFSNTSSLFQMGESVVTETNIDNDYNGTTFIQATSHIIRKLQKQYKNFRANANLTGSESEEERDAKIEAVLKPVMLMCTDLPQKNNNPGYVGSNPLSWERKRLAVIECCEKYKFPYLDLQKIVLENWDLTLEPYFVLPTDKINNKGVMTMDGLHPNKYGWRFILKAIVKKFKEF